MSCPEDIPLCPCQKQRCAWWDEDSQDCAAVVLARAMKNQTFGIGYQFNGNWGGEVAQGQKAKVLAWTPLPKPPKMKRGVKNG